jgi:hypothetical protein
MKNTLIIVLLVVLASPVVAEDLLGLQYSVRVGVTKDNLFQLVEDGVLAEEMNMGNSWFLSGEVRLFVWKFFIGGETEWNFCFYDDRVCNYPYRCMVGTSVGFVPWDFLQVEIGWKSRDFSTFLIPMQYNTGRDELYLEVSGKVGNTR